MVIMLRGWPEDGLIDSLRDAWGVYGSDHHELIDSGILTEPDDTTIEWVDKLTNALRLEAEINSN